MSPTVKNIAAGVFIVVGGLTAIALNTDMLTPGGSFEFGAYAPIDQIKFKDDADHTNIWFPPNDLSNLNFYDAQGQKVSLAEYKGQSNVVLVVMRGFPGYVCPGCTAQTSRLTKNAEQFEKRHATVLVVYPGEKDKIPLFVSAVTANAGSAPKFPILLDPDFAFVDRLGIRGSQAKPSTYILDREGNVRFAYVGASTADRPSLKAILGQLDAINGGPPADVAAVPAGL